MITSEARREWRSFQIAAIAWVLLTCAVTRACAENTMALTMPGGQMVALETAGQ
jgi:hypothetical protein